MLYYLPTTENVASIEDAAKHELCMRFSGVTVDTSKIQKGPDGEPGYLVVPYSASGRQKHVIYDEHNQLWIQSANEIYWLGIADGFTPAEMERPLARSNYPFLDPWNKTFTWRCPTAYSPRRMQTVPQSYYFDENGNLQRVPLDHVTDLFEAASEVLEDYQNPGTISFERMVEIALRALGENYFIWNDELRLLQLAGFNPLNDDMLNLILYALVDGQAIETAKKKDSATSIAPQGSTESSHGNGATSKSNPTVGAS